jgi:homoserine kinase type II
MEVTHSTLNYFLKQYNIGNLLSFKKFKKGFANQVYHLKTTKGDFIFKIIIRHSPEKIKYEIDLLNHLKHLPTAKPIQNKNGQYLTNYSNRKVLIYSYLPGEEKNNFTPEMIRQIGDFLGKLHLQTLNFKTRIKRLEFYNLSEKQLKLMFSSSKRLNDKKIKSALEYTFKNISRFRLPSGLPQGAMHIDVKPENTLFEKTRLSGIVDFDNSYIGPLILDLANTLMWYCSTPNKFDLIKAKNLYKSYQKIRKLNSLEKCYLYEALHFIYLAHTFVDIYWLSLKKLPKKYIIWGIDNLLSAEKNLKISKQEFLKIFN